MQKLVRISLAVSSHAVSRLDSVTWLTQSSLSHHADFIRVLYDEALSRGVQVKFGCDVASVDFDALQVELGSGEIHGADIIVGSDGNCSLGKRLPQYPLIISRHSLHDQIRTALYPPPFLHRLVCSSCHFE